MTEVLRTPDGDMSLRPAQALALHDIGTCKGSFLPIRVGGGKTLISLLAPYMLGAKRPLLLMPAALIDKTERERQQLARHWRIPRHTRFFSYEMLGRVNASNMLDTYRPDLIVADEAHRLKNDRAGVTRRVARYMKANPNTAFVAMSGTIMTHSLRDFADLLSWCLNENAPIPLTDGELQEWADCLDEKVNPLARIKPGVLLNFATPEDTGDDLTRARKGFRRRMCETPGVVSTAGERVDCSLYLTGHEYDVSPTTEAHFQTLRTLWELPCGWPISEAIILWRHARELALGLNYAWDPRPPNDWLESRKAWAVFVRETLKYSKTLDTELQVRQAYPEERTLLDWLRIQPTFTPNSVPVWHDDSALKVCEAWMAKNRGIVWCEHKFFADELAKRTGQPYFGDGGTDAMGRPIEVAKPSDGSIIASVAANSTGRNLQAWANNLVTSCPSGASQWEQLLGRTHRDGQAADQVTVDVLVGCAEHLRGFWQAIEGAKAAQDTLGAEQKLLLADINFPSGTTHARDTSYRWRSTSAKE